MSRPIAVITFHPQEEDYKWVVSRNDTQEVMGSYTHKQRAVDELPSYQRVLDKEMN